MSPYQISGSGEWKSIKSRDGNIPGYRQVWDIPSVRANDVHPAMFPLELAKRVIRLYTDADDIVLDPFLGSGTTAIAALQTGRRFIG